ncbi:MAG: hypothetical protein KatS3mg015_2752 [Fimbriimonadales bacterium]|nr:MAG: hypothetical protein KatS3mg015_2752 [Fimbriimonadales bacterium]
MNFSQRARLWKERKDLGPLPPLPQDGADEQAQLLAIHARLTALRSRFSALNQVRRELERQLQAVEEDWIALQVEWESLEWRRAELEGRIRRLEARGVRAPAKRPKEETVTRELERLLQAIGAEQLKELVALLEAAQR